MKSKGPRLGLFRNLLSSWNELIECDVICAPLLYKQPASYPFPWLELPWAQQKRQHHPFSLHPRSKWLLPFPSLPFLQQGIRQHLWGEGRSSAAFSLPIHSHFLILHRSLLCGNGGGREVPSRCGVSATKKLVAPHPVLYLIPTLG